MIQARKPHIARARCTRYQLLWLLIVLQVSLTSLVGAVAQPVVEIRNEEGHLPKRNFGTLDYRAHAQNWAVVQANNGLIYVANGNGVLEYDGVSWRLIQTDLRAAVRSLAVAADGRIYVGGSGEFGYLDADDANATTFHSLIPHVAPEDEGFMEVWRTVPTADGVYFSTRERLFRWQDGSLQSWLPESSFALGFEFKNDFYTVEPGRGLLRMTDDELVPTEVAEAFINDLVYEVIPFGDDALLITRDNGLLRYDGSRLQPFPTEVDDELLRGRLYHGVAFADGRLALATRAAGVFIVTPDGRLDRVLNEASGMADSQTWNVFEDEQRGLWVALNRGLTRVDLAAEYTFYDQASGLDGLVAAVTRHQGDIYAATSTGVHRLAADKRRFEPVLTEGTGHCLSLESLSTSLLAGCEGGIFDIRSTGTTLIAGQNTRMLYASRRDTNLVYAGSRDGHFRLVRTGDAWEIDGRMDGLPPWALSMYEEDDGRLWLTTVSEGVFSVPPPGSSESVKRYGVDQGLRGGWVYVTPAADQLLFHTQNGIFVYAAGEGEEDGSFVRDTLLSDALLHPDGEVFLLAEDNEGSIWLTNQSDTGRIPTDTEGTGYLPMEVYRQLPESGLFYIYSDDLKDATWIGNESGVMRIDRTTDHRTKEQGGVAIRRVAYLNGDSLLYGGYGRLDAPLVAGPENRSLRFSYALPLFDPIDRNTYQVRLEGQDREWSSWTSETSKDYTNLRPGRYTFHVRGRDAYDQVSREASIQVHVLAPWYQSGWARLFYGALIVLLLWVIVVRINRLRMQRLKSRNAILEREVRDRTLTLKNANERLEHVLTQNNEFVSIAAHDLKNPLAGILGLSSLLLEDELEERDRIEFIGMIRSSALGMSEIVEQLQDVERLDQGVLRLEKRRVNLVAVCQQVLRRNELQADRKKISLVMESAPEVYADIDEQYFPRIVDNLLSNAIKFSPAYSHVWLSIALHDGEAQISIKDEGPGLTAEDRENIFGKLQRLSARPTGGENSTGLGLYIVRMLVELHGGTITVDSELPKGSCFTVALPVSPKPDDPSTSGDGTSRDVSSHMVGLG